MEDADVRWKTVVFHHSVYSTASHVNDGDIIERREELPPVMSELGIDVVLMGHDHVYTRTYMMNGTTPDDSQGVQSEVRHFIYDDDVLHGYDGSAGYVHDQ